MTTRELNTNLEQELERQFPKGDKSRGKALVLFAAAQNELDKLKQKILNLENKMDKMKGGK